MPKRVIVAAIALLGAAIVVVFRQQGRRIDRRMETRDREATGRIPGPDLPVKPPSFTSVTGPHSRPSREQLRESIRQEAQRYRDFSRTAAAQEKRLARLPARESLESAVYEEAARDLALSVSETERLRTIVTDYHRRRRQYYEDQEHAQWNNQGIDDRVARLQGELDASIEALLGVQRFVEFQMAMLPAQRRIVRAERQKRPTPDAGGR
jgi:hypothetical protein